MDPINFISPFAQVHPSAKVWHFAVVLADAEIGEGTVIGSRAEIGRGCWIGINCRIGSGVFLPPNSIIEDGVFIGPNTTFTDDKYPKAGNAGYRAQPPIVRAGASIGAGAVILPGITIGAGALVGAGAVVSHDVSSGVVVKGVPARECEARPIYEEFESICPSTCYAREVCDPSLPGCLRVKTHERLAKPE
jgi:acetyltransferase-like isoleucine patch superfamily enzyme